VYSVDYFALATSTDPARLSAWARLKLQPLHPPHYPPTLRFPRFQLYQPLEPKQGLSRLLARVVHHALTLPEAEPFLVPVNIQEYPDYFQLIK
jgi:hypothetical protein